MMKMKLFVLTFFIYVKKNIKLENFNTALVLLS